jgi:hypothetical protein
MDTEAEVGKLESSGLGDKNVFRLDVAMYDALAVNVC